MQVEPSSPAQKAGVKGGSETTTVNGQEILTGGDIIIGLDGKTIDSIESLRAALQEFKPGDVVKLQIVRAGEQLDFEVELAERPAGNQ